MWFFKILLTSGLSIAVLFVLCRLNGQRTVAQMTVFDYLNGITIGSIAAELATELESWQEPLLAMVLYGLITAGINKLNCKSLAARRVLNGRPVVVPENGRIDAHALSRANIDLNEFLIQCRSAGYFDLNQLLPSETSRPVSPKDLGLTPPQESVWYPLIVDGKLLQENLRAIGCEEKWLQAQLRKFSLHSTAETFLAVSDGRQGFFACAAPPNEKKQKNL